MTTFKICIREENQKGFYPVYIRVIHNRKTAYIKTEKVIHKSKVVNKEIVDAYLVKTLSQKIIEYNDLLNKIDSEKLSVKQIVDFLKKHNQDICFSDYARKYIREATDVAESTLQNYRCALKSLETFTNTNKVMISQLSSHVLQRWVSWIHSNAPSSAENYFHKLGKVFKMLIDDVNDYDNNIITIHSNPFSRISVPRIYKKVDKAIPIDVLRKIFELEPRTSQNLSYAVDVCKISFCLVGMNLVDLFNLKKTSVKGDLICYERQKTKNKRKDRAYIEIKIPEIIKPTIEKYRDDSESEYYFIFRKIRRILDNLTALINNQLYHIAAHLHYDKPLTYYSFRHTWATIAANDVKAGIEEVAFALNHVSAHEITKGYIQTDFSHIWELNERVLALVFDDCKPSNVIASKKEKNATEGKKVGNGEKLKINPTDLIEISLYAGGKKINEITDVGFSSVEEITRKYDADLMKICNLDTGQVCVIKR